MRAQRVGGQQNDRIYVYVDCFKLASSVFFTIDTHCPKCQFNTVSWNVSCAFVELHWTSMCLDILISRSIPESCRSNVKSTPRHMRSCKTWYVCVITDFQILWQIHAQHVRMIDITDESLRSGPNGNKYTDWAKIHQNVKLIRQLWKYKWFSFPPPKKNYSAFLKCLCWNFALIAKIYTTFTFGMGIA